MSAKKESVKEEKKEEKKGMPSPEEVRACIEKMFREDLGLSSKMEIKEVITVNVRWQDGYLEVFDCEEVRGGKDLLWMRLVSGTTRNIPLTGNVRWWNQYPESKEE